MEDKAFRRSRYFPVDDQSEQTTKAPGPSQGQKSSSTITSMSVDSGNEDSHSLEQQVQQEDLEVDISSSTVGSRNHEVLDTQRDTQEFVGAPRRSTRQQRQPSKFNDYVALVSQLVDSEPSSYQEAIEHQVW